MKTQLNLLPEKFRCRQVIRRTLWHWSFVWLLAIAIIVPIGWRKWSGANARRLQIETLEREFEPIRGLKAELITLREKVKNTSPTTTVSFDFDEKRPLPTLIAAISKAAAAADGNVNVQSLVLDRNPTSSQPDEALTGYRLVLKGIAADSAVVTRFVASLRSCNLFQKVNLKSDGQSTFGDIAVQRYEVECSF